MRGQDPPQLDRRHGKSLALIVAVALAASTLFVFILNSGINKRNYEDIISTTLDDIEKDIADTSDINMLDLTLRVKSRVVNLFPRVDMKDVQAVNDELREFVAEEGLSEISVVNKENIVIYSSKDEYIGFDMNSGADTIVFDELNHGATEIVQPVRANAYAGEGSYDQYNKYAGVPLEGVGYLQAAINSQQFQTQIDEKLEYIAANRHIGQTG